MSSACHLTVFKALNFARASVRQSLSSCGTIAYLPKCSLRQIHMEGSKKNDSRGALIVLEGLDRCGKTSQCSRLLSYLEKSGHAVESWRFPDRNTGIGQMISSYLANDSHLDDHAIHLLFSANRWEKSKLLKEEFMEVRDMRSSNFRKEWLNHTRHYVMPHGRAMPALEAKSIVTCVTLGYVDATLPIEDIEKQVRQIVEECLLTCKKGKPFSKLWLN